MSAKQAAADVLGTLVDWLPGYTFPERGPQERIAIDEIDEENPSLLVSYNQHQYATDGRRRYRVRLSVEEVPE